MNIKPVIYEVEYLAILAAAFTGIMLLLPTYPESDLWGKFLNNFLYFVGFYFAARIVLNFGVKGK